MGGRFLLILFLLTLSCAKTKKLVIYTSFPEPEAEFYLRAFQRETGIDVDWVRLSAGLVLARLEAERVRPSADVWYGGPSDTFVSAKGKGLLAPYKSPLAEKLDPRFKDDEGYWTGIYFGAIGFATNVNILKEKRLEPPGSWYDLLNPQWKGLVQMAYPYTSGTGYTICATLVQLMGEKGAFRFMKQLNRNILHYTSSGTAPINQVGLGEAGVAISFSHDILRIKEAMNLPLILTFPKEGTGYEIGAVAMIKGAAHPKLAKRFIDWALSAHAQDLYGAFRSFRIPLNPQTKLPKEVIPISQIKLIPYDHQWAGANRKRLMAKWKEEILR